MTLPSKPSRTFSFQGHSQALPTTPQPGVNLDNEIDKANNAVGGLIDHVSVSIAADGTLKGHTVSFDNLAPSVLDTLNVLVRDYVTPIAVDEARDWAVKLDGPVRHGHYSARFWAVQTSATVDNFNQNAQAMFQAAAQTVIDQTNSAAETATTAAGTATTQAGIATGAAQTATEQRDFIEPLANEALTASSEAVALVNQLVDLIYDFGIIGGPTGDPEDWGLLA